MRRLTKKKVIIILAVILVYTIVGAFILSNLTNTRDATQEEIEYYQAFLTDWKAIPGVDSKLSEKDIILSMCTLQTPAVTGPSSTGDDPTAATDATQATDPDADEYTSKEVPKYLLRYKSDLSLAVKDNVLILAYMDEEDHYVLVTYDDKGVKELVVHNQKKDEAYFQQGDIAQVVTNFSFSLTVDRYY